MYKYLDEGVSAAVSILVISMILSFVLVGALVVGGLIVLVREGYKQYKKRNDPPQLGPWAEPSDVSAFGWDAGLRLGKEVTWD